MSKKNRIERRREVRKGTGALRSEFFDVTIETVTPETGSYGQRMRLEDVFDDYTPVAGEVEAAAAAETLAESAVRTTAPKVDQLEELLDQVQAEAAATVAAEPVVAASFTPAEQVNVQTVDRAQAEAEAATVLERLMSGDAIVVDDPVKAAEYVRIGRTISGYTLEKDGTRIQVRDKAGNIVPQDEWGWLMKLRATAHTDKSCIAARDSMYSFMEATSMVAASPFALAAGLADGAMIVVHDGGSMVFKWVADGVILGVVGFREILNKLGTFLRRGWDAFLITMKKFFSWLTDCCNKAMAFVGRSITATRVATEQMVARRKAVQAATAAATTDSGAKSAIALLLSKLTPMERLAVATKIKLASKVERLRWLDDLITLAAAA